MATLQTAIGPGDHAAGPPDAPMQLVEYGDYECPYCRRALAELDVVQRILETRLVFVYRHFPLVQKHPHALLAAEAAEAAGAQGRFWEMHRLLYAHQRALAREDLDAYAAELGLDGARFAADLDDHVHLEAVQRAVLGGARSGVRGTPAFFVNGARHEGPYDADALIDALTGSGPPLHGY